MVFSVAGTTTTVDANTMQAANGIVFEGATADDFESTLRSLTRQLIAPSNSLTSAVASLFWLLIAPAIATPAELNVLDGITASVSELNLLDGVTSSTAELNILDGVTAAEVNLLDGVTSTTAELNILDGVTATATELNLLMVVLQPPLN